MSKKKSTKGEPATLREAAEQLAADEKQAKLPIVSHDVAITREEVELPHALADTEVQHVTAQVMALEVEITALSKDLGDLQTEARGIAKTITKKRAEASKLAAEAHTKVRHVRTGVRVEHDYPAAQLRYYRLDRGAPDVGELYDTVAMPPEEREQAIFTAPKDGDRVVLDDGDEAVNAKGGDA